MLRERRGIRPDIAALALVWIYHGVLLAPVPCSKCELRLSTRSRSAAWEGEHRDRQNGGALATRSEDAAATVLKVKLPHEQRCMFSGMMLLVGARTHEEAKCLRTMAERCFLTQNGVGVSKG